MKKPTIFNILVLWTGFFGLLSNSFRGFDKIAFYLSEGMFWRRIVSEQNISILSFLHNEQTFPTFGWNFLGGVVKTALCVSAERLWGDKKWKNQKFSTFSFFEREFSDFCRILTGGLSKLPSTCPKEGFEEELFLNKTSLFYHFRTMSKHFQLLVEIFWAVLSKLHSWCSQQHFEEENHFFEKIISFFYHFQTLCEKKFGFLVVCFRLGCQSSILRVSRKNWEKCCWKD